MRKALIPIAFVFCLIAPLATSLWAAEHRAISALKRRLPLATLQAYLRQDPEEQNYYREETMKFTVQPVDNPICGSCWGVAVRLVSVPNWKEIRRREVLDLGASQAQLRDQEGEWGPQNHVWVSYFVSNDGTIKGTDYKSNIFLNYSDSR